MHVYWLLMATIGDTQEVCLKRLSLFISRSLFCNYGPTIISLLSYIRFLHLNVFSFFFPSFRTAPFVIRFLIFYNLLRSWTSPTISSAPFGMEIVALFLIFAWTDTILSLKVEASFYFLAVISTDPLTLVFKLSDYLPSSFNDCSNFCTLFSA